MSPSSLRRPQFLTWPWRWTAAPSAHNPHASAQRKLVRLPQRGRMRRLPRRPDSRTPTKWPTVSIDLIGCEACHEPHGGSQEKMLRIAGSELCLECHGPSAMEVPQGVEKSRVTRSIPYLRSRRCDDPDPQPLRRRSAGTSGRRSPSTGARPRKRKLGNTETNFQGDLTCLTCHDPSQRTVPRAPAVGAPPRQQKLARPVI